MALELAKEGVFLIFEIGGRGIPTHNLRKVLGGSLLSPGEAPEGEAGGPGPRSEGKPPPDLRVTVTPSGVGAQPAGILGNVHLSSSLSPSPP